MLQIGNPVKGAGVADAGSEDGPVEGVAVDGAIEIEVESLNPGDGFGETLGEGSSTDGGKVDDAEGSPDGKRLVDGRIDMEGMIDVDGATDVSVLDGVEEGADDCWRDGIPDGPFVNSLEGPFEGATLEDTEGFVDGI